MEIPAVCAFIRERLHQGTSLARGKSFLSCCSHFWKLPFLGRSLIGGPLHYEVLFELLGEVRLLARLPKLTPFQTTVLVALAAVPAEGEYVAHGVFVPDHGLLECP